MKPCIYFEPKVSNDNFEGTRLRKNIKKALENQNIAYAKSIIDIYDLIHFISLNDELKINDAVEQNIPVVFSALNCESDESARTLDRNYGLSQKTIKLLNKVDLVLVSDSLSMKFLSTNGIKKPIKIVSPGVSLSRFEFDNLLEENIFYNYYQLEKGSKFVVSIGGSEDKENLKILFNIAKLCPNVLFFYFTPKKENKITNIIFNKIKNVKICSLLNSELYASMMKCATIFLQLTNMSHSPISILDAAASKTQLVSISYKGLNEDYLDSCKCYYGDNAEELSKIINGLINNELKYTTEEAFEFAKNNSIENLGISLVQIYENLLREKKND